MVLSAAILIIVWFLGVLTSYTIGGFIHLLLLIALALLLARYIQGRRPPTALL